MQDYKREEYKVFELFDKKWALVTAGNIQHYNCCTVSWGSLGNIWGTAGNSRSTVTVYVHPARYTSEVLKESDILGVTWGSTVYHMINYLNPSQKVNAKFVTLHGSIACCENELDVRTLVSRMAKAFFGENYYLLTDALMSSKEASRIMKEEKKNPFLHLRILCSQRIWRC